MIEVRLGMREVDLIGDCLRELSEGGEARWSIPGRACTNEQNEAARPVRVDEL